MKDKFVDISHHGSPLYACEHCDCSEYREQVYPTCESYRAYIRQRDIDFTERTDRAEWERLKAKYN